MNHAEVIQEVERNGENLTELLRFGADQLEPNCLNRALAAAVNNDNQFNIGKLIIKGANNIEDCLRQSRDHYKPHARAMLLLVKAAMQGDRNLVLKLFGESVPEMDTQEYQDDSFKDAQKVLLAGEISTVVPIEIARRNGQTEVRGELLLKTDVNVEEGIVYWHGLRLLVLDVSWLKRIDWVRKLRLARNGFKQLPDEIGTYLKRVRFAASSLGHSQILSHSRGEKSEKGLGSKLRHGPEMVDSVNTNLVHVMY